MSATAYNPTPAVESDDAYAEALRRAAAADIGVGLSDGTDRPASDADEVAAS